MKFSAVREAVGSVPFISHTNAKIVYEMILSQRPLNILELGIGHGTATCYMAAALDEIGQGQITAVDLSDAQYSPSPETQLLSLTLDKYAHVVRMQTGYTWFLHDEIRRQTVGGQCQPKYDLCVIDGPKNWTIDGCAFFLVDKLLKPQGWIIFDDYAWTYGAADRRRPSTDGITHRDLSEEERNTPQIQEVFELLVMQHPSYSNAIVHARKDWAMAQKIAAVDKTYTIRYRTEYGNLINRLAVAGKLMFDRHWRRTRGGNRKMNPGSRMSYGSPIFRA
jgi:predicted O-methyltransferase YrrM